MGQVWAIHQVKLRNMGHRPETSSIFSRLPGVKRVDINLGRWSILTLTR